VSARPRPWPRPARGGERDVPDASLPYAPGHAPEPGRRLSERPDAGIRGRLALAAAVPRRDALLLLPALPARAAVFDPVESWSAALDAWGVVAAPGAAGEGQALAVGSDSAVLAAAGAESVLLIGADTDGRLAAAGYRLAPWRVTRTRHETTALVPVGEAGMARALRAGGSRRRPRQLAVDLVDRVRGAGVVTVAARGQTTPLVLRSALQGPQPVRAALLVGSATARRRPVFVVHGATGAPDQVLKVGRGDDAAARARREQDVLARLAALAVRDVPDALGAGSVQGLEWSAESAVPGRPLASALTDASSAAGLRLLERVAEWLTELSLATLGPRAPDAGLRLRAPHLGASELLAELDRVPGVLVHGDLHGNVLVDGSAFGVIDWELARCGGLPLHDVLPLLCKGLMAVRRVPLDGAAALLLPALRGESEDGRWLLAQVHRVLARLGLGTERGGALAGLALASWASKRLVHDELVLAAGVRPEASASAADVLAPAWLQDPLLGASWPALRRLGAGT
jgi:hypothetical protein